MLLVVGACRFVLIDACQAGAAAVLRTAADGIGVILAAFALYPPV